MYDKWNLNRYPFYTRPIDRENIEDFWGREAELKQIRACSRSKEGVVAIIGQRGVGTTSVANYARFSEEKGYTFAFEVRVEQLGTAAAVLEAIVYSMAADMVERRIQSKAAKRVVSEYTGNGLELKVRGKLGPVGMDVGSKRGGKSIFPVLYDTLRALVSDVLKKRKYEFCIFQLNNLDVPQTMSEKTMKEVLDPLRDVFHTRGTVWYLLGDSGFKSVIERELSRVSSIVKHWVMVGALNAEQFKRIYDRRIENSGKNAVSPFTEDAVRKLCECSIGRPRFALDVAGRIMEQHADTALPKFIDAEIVEKHALQEIYAIEEMAKLPEKTMEALRLIASKPGRKAAEVAEALGIAHGNLSKYIQPLVRKQLITSRKEGRSVLYFPEGFGTLIGG